MDNTQDISKENFNLELRSLLDTIDGLIESMAKEVTDLSGHSKSKSKIAEVNKLKLHEYKLKEMFETIPALDDDQWIYNRERMIHTFQEAEALVK